MAPTVDIVFKPICLRFSQHRGAVVYHSASEPYAQLDGMEELMKIDPTAQPILNMNLGFLPVAHTILIRGDRSILVDPNNFHIGAYGMLEARLRELDSAPDDIDIVVNTHCHHDHSGSNRAVRDRTLIVGEGELEAAEAFYGPEFVHANFTGIMRQVQKVRIKDGLMPIDEGVYVVKTPGHSPGSVCVLVESSEERWAIMGDSVMMRQEYTERAWGHWYPEEQVTELNHAVDRIREWGPTIVVPGHDWAFSPNSKTRIPVNQ